MNLLSPHITEKSYRTISQEKKEVSTYTFKVNSNLNKGDVKRMIEKEYKVTVVDVRIINLPAKIRRFKGIPGKVSPISKALVRLKAGDRINAFEIEDTSVATKE